MKASIISSTRSPYGDYASAHRNLGEAYAMQGRLGLAAGEYLRALDLMPSDVPLLNRASWILATSPDAAVRDGGRARALAERAVRLTSEHDAESLDSLAAAFAEQGSFEAARQAARHALAEAHLMADSDLVQQIEFRLKTYEQDRAFRDAAR